MSEQLEVTTQSGHEVTIEVYEGVVYYEFVCHEPEGAGCRLMCPKGCETWPCFDDADDGTEVEHELVDGGTCNVVDYLENSDAPGEDMQGRLRITRAIEPKFESDHYEFRIVE